ncbi:MAG: hypothetical protein M1837_003594 [Sclerophora amabilis]|nr:MAG: hypothetical protein M1837_003594 [Sclerophora amabilis]
MAANVPSGLKSADISRFALRASQVEKVKPVIAYWCNYYIVNQILSKGLHTGDADSTKYTTDMMDKLETMKASHPNEDAILDDVPAQAYVEQFGLETFERADKTVKANKVTRQTADTFQAAATFLELSHIWGTPEAEIAAKIKFAKYHAVRIAKAVKAGEDPNLSNPAPEPAAPETVLDPEDPEVQLLDTPPPGKVDRQAQRQASVEEVPDEHDRIQRSLAARSSLDESLHPSRSSSIPPQPTNLHIPSPPSQLINGESVNYASGAGEVSPLEPSPTAPQGPVGGGYFPDVPTFTSEMGASNMPTAPAGGPSISPPAPDFPDASQPPPSSTSFGRPPPSPDLTSQPTLSSHPPPISPPAAAPAPPPSQLNRQPYAPHQPPPTAPPQDFYRQQPAVPTQPPPPRPPQAQAQAPQAGAHEVVYRADEEAVARAQKHARWAISALNFEDVKTAVQELRGALDSLGAR